MENHNDIDNEDKPLKEDDEQSMSDDRLRSCSSVSSVSNESSITNYSSDEQNQVDKRHYGHEQVEHIRLGDPLPLELPPIQSMDRASDANSEYRIPSYVFASNKSSNPEWSVASNESLFSIHAGNMSFTREQFNWLLKSGELSLYGPSELPKSGELPPPLPIYVSKSGEQKPKGEKTPLSSPKTLKPGEEIIAAHFFKTLTTTSSEKDEKEDHNINQIQVTEVFDSSVRGKKDDHSKEKISSPSTSPSDDNTPLANCVSHHSDTSGQSFAFPVLAEIGRDKSVNSAHSHARGDQQKKNTLLNEQEVSTPTKGTPEAPPASSSWFSSCFCCHSCC